MEGQERESVREQWNKLGIRILNQARNELYLSMRYLEPVFAMLELQHNASILVLGTDGFRLYFQPMLLAKRYEYNPVLVNRAYLHSLLHCLFRHMEGLEGRDRERWDLACDVAVEYHIDHMDYNCTRQLISEGRQQFYKRCGKKLSVITAEGVYRLLEQEQVTDRELISLSMDFLVDDHRFWENKKDDQQNDNNPSPEEQQEQMQLWQDVSEKVKTAMETYARDQGDKAGSLKTAIGVKNRRHYDYREFLRKFAALREEMKIDPDSFDYIFYHYGMEHYGNMPLIEELEYREEQRVEDFVIALDTSGSCSGTMIRKFLEEAAQILMTAGAFRERCNIHIVQCDAKIQDVQVIRNKEDLNRYLEQFQVKGFGGTDFRPVFRYVEQVQRAGGLRGLKGLLYFTDGYGTYPARRPAYQTAFLFVGEDAVQKQVPAWAMKLIIDEEI